MIKKIFLNDRFILFLIIVNSFVIFLNGFSLIDSYKKILFIVDNVITLLFIIELIMRIKG